MAYTETELHRFFIDIYNFVYNQIRHNKNARATLKTLLTDNESLAAEQDWQPLQAYLIDDDENIRNLTSIAAHSALLFTDPGLNAGTSPVISSLTLSSSSIDLSGIALASLSPQQWEILNNLLRVIPGLVSLNIQDLAIHMRPLNDANYIRTWREFCAIVSSLIYLQTLAFINNGLIEVEFTNYLQAFLLALENSPKLTTLKLSQNNISFLSYAEWKLLCLSLAKISNLQELDLSATNLDVFMVVEELDNDAFISGQTRWEVFCAALKQMPKLRVLNISHNQFETQLKALEGRKNWHLFWKTAGSMQQLRTIVLTHDQSLDLYMADWEPIYFALTANSNLFIEGLPSETPFKIKMLNLEHLITYALIVVKELSTDLSSNVAFKQGQAEFYKLDRLMRDTVSFSALDPKIRQQLQNAKDDLLWALTRRQLDQLSQSSKVDNDDTMEPALWLAISASSPHYLTARAELFGLIYNEHTSTLELEEPEVIDTAKATRNAKIRREAFVTALPALLDDEFKFLALGEWETTLNHLLSQAINIRATMGVVFTKSTQLAYLQYLFLSIFLNQNPAKRTTILETSARAITTSTSFFATNSLTNDEPLADIVDLQDITNAEVQHQLQRYWRNLITSVNSDDLILSDNHHACIHAITHLEQEFNFMQHYEQNINQQKSPQSAFVAAMVSCLSENAGDIHFNVALDRLLLTSMGFNDQLATTLDIKTRLALLQYLCILHLSQQEVAEDYSTLIKKTLADLTSSQFKSTITEKSFLTTDTRNPNRATASFFLDSEKTSVLLFTAFQDPAKQTLLNNLWQDVQSHFHQQTASQMQLLFSYINQFTPQPPSSSSSFTIV